MEETLVTILGQKDHLESLRALYRQSTEAIASTNSSEERIKTIKANLKGVLEAPLNTTKRPELSAFRRKMFVQGILAFKIIIIGLGGGTS